MVAGLNIAVVALVASSLASTTTAAPTPARAPTAAPERAPTPESAPAPEPTPESAPAPEPTPVPPAPESAPVPAAPAPAPVVQEERSSGLGFLIAGPVVVALGVPFSLLGSDAWRKSCGPTNSDLQCSGGTVRSVASHTVSLFSYGTGIVLTGIGGKRYGRYSASEDARSSGRVHDRSGFVLAGAILLPASLVGMITARTLYWIPTPRCETERCVKTYQRTSTAVVGGFAFAASASAGLLLYGASYRGWVRDNVQLSVAPSIGRGSGGLVVRGEF